jgi:arylsulfatase A-like enzyme
MQEAEQFIRDNAGGPFFLYLALTIPHANNEAGREGMEVPDLGEYAGKDWPDPSKGHAAMITRMDAGIGRLLDLLKELNIDGRTIVFFSSDNGPHREGGNDPEFNNSNGPLRGIKRDLYEGGIRVPLIVRWPGRIKPGRQTDHLSANWDFLPTCAGLAALPEPEGIDGISFLPVLLGQKQKAHSYLYWEFFEEGGKQAVRMGRWKGVRLNADAGPDGPIELYDLETDLGEQTNLADRHPKIVRQICEIMKAAHVRNEAYLFGYEKVQAH